MTGLRRSQLARTGDYSQNPRQGRDECHGDFTPTDGQSIIRAATANEGNGTIMKPDDIVKSWSANDLRRWPVQCLRDVAIPEPSKSFLVEVGLTVYSDVGFQFHPLVGDPPRLAGRPHLRSIGRMFEAALVCLDEQADGHVILVDPSLRYLNSRVDRFAACLILYLQLRAIAQRSRPTEIPKEFAARFERDLLNVDPTIFSDPENFWAVIVWEMKQGLG
jgi:hypothetical protein